MYSVFSNIVTEGFAARAGMEIISVIISLTVISVLSYFVLKKADQKASIIILALAVVSGIIGSVLFYIVSSLIVFCWIYFEKKMFDIAWSNKAFVFFASSVIAFLVFQTALAVLFAKDAITTAATIALLALTGASIMVAEILLIVKNFKLAKSFGYGNLFSIITMFFPVIQYAIIAIGRHDYVGEEKKNADVKSEAEQEAEA